MHIIVVQEVIYLTPCELTASITAFANVFASKLNDDEIEVWSSVFSQLGYTLETISAQRRLINKSCECTK